ncbi:hypothetical protein GGI42DRAFT_180230 [Trichoderma sp. SZMC 28013]
MQWNTIGPKFPPCGLVGRRQNCSRNWNSTINAVAELSRVAKNLHSQLASRSDDYSKKFRRIGIPSSLILGCEETGLSKSWSSCVQRVGSKYRSVVELSSLLDDLHNQVENGGEDATSSSCCDLRRPRVYVLKFFRTKDKAKGEIGIKAFCHLWRCAWPTTSGRNDDNKRLRNHIVKALMKCERVGARGTQVVCLAHELAEKRMRYAVAFPGGRKVVEQRWQQQALRSHRQGR